MIFDLAFAFVALVVAIYAAGLLGWALEALASLDAWLGGEP